MQKRKKKKTSKKLQEILNKNEALKCIKENENLELVRLLKDGLEVNQIYEGVTLSIFAVIEKNFEALELLESYGADLNQIDFLGMTALMHASKIGRISIIEFLFNCGVDVNQKNIYGRTALFYAVFSNKKHAIQLLLENKADANITDNEGKVAEYYTQDEEIISLLRENIQSLNYNDEKEKKNASEVTWLKTWIERAERFDQFDELKAAPKRIRPLKRISFIGIFISAITLIIPLAQMSYWSLFPLSVITIFSLVFIPNFSKESKLFYCSILISSFSYSGFFYLAIIIVILCLNWLLNLFPSVFILIWLYLQRKNNVPIVIKPELTNHIQVSDWVADRRDNSLSFIASVCKVGVVNLRNILRLENNPLGQKTANNYTSRIISSLLFLLISMSLIYYLFTPFKYTFPIVIISQLTGMFLCLRLERFLVYQRLKKYQKHIDKKAGDLSAMVEMQEHISLNENKEFALYLRPFESTNKILINNIDFETQLAYSLNEYIPIVALGQPGEHLGVGRIISTETEWQNQVERLIIMAKLVLIFPSNSEGTLWEIKYIREKGHLHKSIFVMPPIEKINNKPFKLEWEKATDALKQYDIILPDYFERGLIFNLDENGKLYKYEPFSIDKWIYKDSIINHESGSNQQPVDTPSDVNDTDEVHDELPIFNSYSDVSHDGSDSGGGGSFDSDGGGI